MSTISTDQVKALRDQTGVSVMQCKKALEETNGNMEEALVILRRKGSEIAAKKADRSAADGAIVIKSNGKKAVSLILNCETDFVAKNDDFKAAAEKLATIAFEEGAEKAKEAAPEIISAVVLKIGENIQLGAIEEITGDTVAGYTHFTGKSAAIVVLKGGDEAFAKELAMHVAAMKPQFLSKEQIPADVQESAKAVFQKEVDESGKPEDMKAKILEGKLSGYFKDQTLLEQPFFLTGDKTIAQLLKEHGDAIIESFKLYTIA